MKNIQDGIWDHRPSLRRMCCYDGPCILIPLRNLKDAECGIEDFEEKTHCKLNGEKMRIQTDRIQNEPWEYKYE